MAADVGAGTSRRPGRVAPAPVARALVVGWLVIGLSGCTGAAPEPAPPGRANDLVTPSATSGLPAAPTRIPAASSGPLNPAVLPAAADLGSGWTERIEGADAEDGVGNETAFQERDPVEIVSTTVPMGCEGRSTSPAPQNVLQATYRHRPTGAYAVALRMRFVDQAAAREFAEVRLQDLRSCRVQGDDPPSGAPTPVLDVSGTGDRHLVTYRLVGEDPTWVGGLQRMGADVLTVDSDAAPVDLLDWAGVGLPSP
ncbi:MAG: hypothetical protein WCF36_04810 [Candidatus Nanopelagicales bacterium]